MPGEHLVADPNKGLLFTYPEQLEMTDIEYYRETDELLVGFIRGGRVFQVRCRGFLFPTAVTTLENVPPGPYVYDVHKELARFFASQARRLIEDFCNDERSLMSFLYSWTIPFHKTDGKLSFGRPICGERITRDLFGGLEYRSWRLPSYNWNAVEVLEQISCVHYQVILNGECFGCYVPDGRFRGPGDMSFFRMLQEWERITFSDKALRIRAPFLRGLVRAGELVQGALYDWIEPSTANPTLAQVSIDRISVQQRKIWSAQIQSSVEGLHEANADWLGWRSSSSVAENILISAKGEAYLRTLHLGAYVIHGEKPRADFSSKTWAWEVDKRADTCALAEIRRFLKIDTNYSITASTKTFLDLPAELRNRVYEHLLVYEEYVQWSYGRFLRTVRHPNSPRLPLDGYGLFGTNREIRQESLSLLVERNNIVLEAMWIEEFLELGVGRQLRRLTIILCLSMNRTARTSQLNGVKELRRQCKSLRSVQLVIRNDLEDGWWCCEALQELKKITGVVFRVHAQRHEDRWFKQDIEDWLSDA
ncbi:hypothetical protein SLS56_005166 [Neofusicoccum ribis]|uniref:Uncharacterized protein n=1 Tax=Neofusicoccum ribis TaxID=45134 RepID=A0ABR3SUH9_9PEZI